MTIAFTGHRDKHVADAQLADLHAEFPDAVWVHGGAAGFDAQVSAYAKAHGIPEVVYPPDYRHYGRWAPLVRNHEIVAGAHLLIACYDGRKSGGTAYTIRLAETAGIPVRIWEPVAP